MTRVRVAGAVLVAFVSVGCARDVEGVRVAAASDLQFALTEIADHFTTDTGARVELVFGSSGTLTRQIQDGAPYSVFFSADEAFVERLVQGGHTNGDGALYATGRIVLFAPPGSPMVPADGLDGLTRLLETKKVSRLAIANPEHAPYGRAAEQALRARGIWEAIQPSLVLGENVSQAAQFAAGGNTVGGIIAYSLALAPAMQDRGTYALLPSDTHAPLRQRMVLLKGANPAADRFYAYVQAAAARATLAKHGFVLPE